MSRVICFDTETTGLGDDDEIIQLSIVDALSGEVLLNEYYRPSDHLMERGWDDAAAVTGVYPDDVADCPSLSDPEVKAEVEEIFAGADTIIGYHVCYDVKMLARSGIYLDGKIFQDPMYSFASYYWSSRPDETYTTKAGKVRSPWMSFLWDGFGGKGRYVQRNLSFAAGYFGIEDFGAHDSLNDVYATIDVWHEMNEIQDAAYCRGIAYDDDGCPMFDIDGNECFTDENGRPCIDPNGRAIIYVQDYTLEQLFELDR